MFKLGIAYDTNIADFHEDICLDCVKNENQKGPIKINLSSASPYRYIRINVAKGVEAVINGVHLQEGSVHLLWDDRWHIFDNKLDFITQPPKSKPVMLRRIIDHKITVAIKELNELRNNHNR